MAFGDVVLALLDAGPGHGYDLKRRHDQWFAGARPVAFAQVYAALGRLDRDGLVRVAQVETEGGPERTVYELTGPGRDRLSAWLGDPVDATPPAVEEMVRRAVAAIRTGRDPVGFVARQREALLGRMRALTTGPGADHPPGAADLAAVLVREHAIAHLDADLRWLDVATEMVADGLTSREPARRATRW